MRQLYQWRQDLRQTAPWRWVLGVALAAVIGVAAGHTVLGTTGSLAVVDGVSMEPTFPPGTRVYSQPITTALQRGDIVLLDDGHKDFALKRIVGMPGETVQLWRGYVFINRKMLREPYLPKYDFTFPDQLKQTYSFQLGPDQFFVLGDNRLWSVDSRSYGPVERKQIKSRVAEMAEPSRPRFDAYTLPAEGKRTIRPLPAA